jgi:hypothetical protein
MILKTKVEVTYNDPHKMTGTLSSVLFGQLKNVSRTGKSYLGANFSYLIATEDPSQFAPVMTSAFELKTEEEILALNDMIKDDLPVYEETPEPEFEDLKYMLAFRLEMVKTLQDLNPNLTVEDIEIL